MFFLDKQYTHIQENSPDTRVMNMCYDIFDGAIIQVLFEVLVHMDRGLVADKLDEMLGNSDFLDNNCEVAEELDNLLHDLRGTQWYQSASRGGEA